MGEKEYYVDLDSATAIIHDAYLKYMRDMFIRCKVAKEEDADAHVAAEMAI